MIITKEHQEAMLTNYIKKGKTTDEVLGFYDGMTEMLEFIERKMKEKEKEIKILIK
jgi:hypothetical protein